VHATLGSIEVDAHGDTWLHVVGKGIPTAGLLAQVLVAKYLGHLQL
jgi:hypothetical protein